jgi:hypothetical protein
MPSAGCSHATHTHTRSLPSEVRAQQKCMVHCTMVLAHYQSTPSSFLCLANPAKKSGLGTLSSCPVMRVAVTAACRCRTVTKTVQRGRVTADPGSPRRIPHWLPPWYWRNDRTWCLGRIYHSHEPPLRPRFRLPRPGCPFSTDLVLFLGRPELRPILSAVQLPFFSFPLLYFSFPLLYCHDLDFGPDGNRRA